MSLLVSRDYRISSDNYMFEMSIEAYVDLAKRILDNNEFQRRRIKSSRTVYSLLKEDIKKGCIIPPIVLALTRENVGQGISTADDVINLMMNNSESLLILDGIQRTHTIIDLIRDETSSLFPGDLSFMQNKIRIELYVGLNKLGILYRMLTLNTGQTPMSLRQQIEILYLDYIRHGVGQIRLIREIDPTNPDSGLYNFRDIVEGFNSYLERNELPLSKIDLLENIKSLEKLSIENQNSDLFEEFITVWDNTVKRFIRLIPGEVYLDDFDTGIDIFARNMIQILLKQQVICGFGAAAGKLKDFGIITELREISDLLPSLQLHEMSDREYIIKLNKILDNIANSSRKIGNSQRAFFQYYFRDLFNKDSDSFRRVDSALDSAYRKYQSQYE